MDRAEEMEFRLLKKQVADLDEKLKKEKSKKHELPEYMMGGHY